MCLATGSTPKCHFVSKFPSGGLEILEIGILATLESHNFVCRPPIEVRFKVKLYPLSRAFQRYLVSFDHNLCIKYPNGSCEPILDIYIPRAFQWYKEIFNPMGFDPCDRSLKIWKSIETPILKVGAHLRMWRFIPSHSRTLPRAWNVTPGLHSWLAPSQALALVASPKLKLRHMLNLFSFNIRWFELGSSDNF